MKLWLISVSDDDIGRYDVYDSAVVAAEDEKAARETTPFTQYDGSPGKWGDGIGGWNSWVDSPDKVKAELIGEATPGTEAGVILASFNAG